MSLNTAAWLIAAKKHPLEVGEAPMREPQGDEILVKNHAVAVNPVDGYVQKSAYLPVTYPAILGTDVAGEVAAVGPNATRFKVGDRVVGHALVLLNLNNDEAAFQKYTILKSHVTSEIPYHMAFEDAVVLPLTLSTAATSLFMDLQLQLPTEPAQKPTGKTILVWGGASSVGSNAIQLAVAAGYEVITTASAQNFEYVKKLGANQVFDYTSPTVRDDIVNALESRSGAGILDCIGFSAVEACLEIAQRTPEGSGFKFVSTTKPRHPTPPEGVQIKHIRGDDIVNAPLAKEIYEHFLPQALQAGSYDAAPKPTVIGKGLEHVQRGIDLLSKGVSATKIVITL